MTTETPNGAAEAVTEDTAAASVEAVEQEAPEAVEEFEGEGEPEPEVVAEAEKPKKTAKDRINELTWRANEAERREQALLERLAKTEKPAEDAAPAPVAEDARPDPADYEFGVTDEKYIEDLSEWKVDQRLRQHDEQTSARQRFQKSLDTFHTKATEMFPEGEPEGLKAYKALPDAGSVVLQQMVIDSDVGPKLADYLGKNTAEIKRISGLHPLLQAREIGKLEARMSEASPPKPAKTVSDAPALPTHQVRGGGGKFAVSPDTDDFASFDKAYGI